MLRLLLLPIVVAVFGLTGCGDPAADAGASFADRRAAAIASSDRDRLLQLGADIEAHRTTLPDAAAREAFDLAVGDEVPGPLAARRRAEQVAIGAELRQLVMALVIYEADQGGPAEDLEQLLQYTNSPRPSRTQPIYLPSQVLRSNVPVVCADPLRTPGSLVLAYGDGQVATVRGVEALAIWQALMVLQADAAPVSVDDWDAVVAEVQAELGID